MQSSLINFHVYLINLYFQHLIIFVLHRFILIPHVYIYFAYAHNSAKKVNAHMHGGMRKKRVCLSLSSRLTGM